MCVGEMYPVLQQGRERRCRLIIDHSWTQPVGHEQDHVVPRLLEKNEQNFYGYKNHVSIDRKHKLDRRYTETDASVHDSQKLAEVLDKSNTGSEVWADSAYRSAESEAKLKEQGSKSRVHRRGVRNHPLSQRQQAANTSRSRVRVRVEHVFCGSGTRNGR
jgi:transposase, IS5 family